MFFVAAKIINPNHPNDQNVLDTEDYRVDLSNSDTAGTQDSFGAAHGSKVNWVTSVGTPASFFPLPHTHDAA